MHITLWPFCLHETKYLKLDVIVGGGVEQSDHDEGKIDPQVISKHDSIYVLFTCRVGNLERTPARPTMGGVSKTI